MHIRNELYVSRVMRYKHYPSIIVLNVRRDVPVMHVIHVMSLTLLL